eukprot:TRINITY_DN41059_c0_g1_i1.p1 TRINITY_DN41059_c0_g1~~TRINITY_DN41059_c0_g1_i1.p1  ORF type:complete len:428 (+),score=78.16 TRINITY_DN41059_c0_g1_i1:46-1284(+)
MGVLAAGRAAAYLHRFSAALWFLLLDGPALVRSEQAVPSNAGLPELRQLRNSKETISDVGRLAEMTSLIEKAMEQAYLKNATGAAACPSGSGVDLAACPAGGSQNSLPTRPGNFHGVKGHMYYVNAIMEAHPSFTSDQVHSIVASEWYHPGLTAKAVWCVDDCGEQFRLARRLDENAARITKEVMDFFAHPDAQAHLKGVGSHTTEFDRRISGNGTWVDVRLWRGRAFNRKLCEKHFRVICAVVETSPEVWTNPWSHVLLSVLTKGSWVPFHQGHTNGQLTYHFPVTAPVDPSHGIAELAVVERGGTDDHEKARRLEHPEERTVSWKKGRTLVFDDSFTHAVRFREGTKSAAPVESIPSLDADARVVLLMRAWHPELQPAERSALREFVRRGGEERPEGYELLPISDGVFSL